MAKILVINGSYRQAGVTDQIVDIMVEELRASGAEVEVIELRNLPIEFCLNCRTCTQQPGAAPGVCVHDDEMPLFVAKLEDSEAYILAAPTNFGSVTAVFKRFMERLLVYAYWPWSAAAPKLRKSKPLNKKALLVSSCAAPGFWGRWIYGSHKQLKMTARTLGADVVGTQWAGLVAMTAEYKLTKSQQIKARVLAQRLI